LSRRDPRHETASRGDCRVRAQGPQRETIACHLQATHFHPSTQPGACCHSLTGWRHGRTVTQPNQQVVPTHSGVVLASVSTLPSMPSRLHRRRSRVMCTSAQQTCIWTLRTNGDPVFGMLWAQQVRRNDSPPPAHKDPLHLSRTCRRFVKHIYSSPSRTLSVG
jgi:hypothetical protein